jgi:hypothetical protein
MAAVHLGQIAETELLHGCMGVKKRKSAITLATNTEIYALVSTANNPIYLESVPYLKNFTDLR